MIGQHANLVRSSVFIGVSFGDGLSGWWLVNTTHSHKKKQTRQKNNRTESSELFRLIFRFFSFFCFSEDTRVEDGAGAYFFFVFVWFCWFFFAFGGASSSSIARSSRLLSVCVCASTCLMVRWSDRSKSETRTGDPFASAWNFSFTLENSKKQTNKQTNKRTTKHRGDVFIFLHSGTERWNVLRRIQSLKCCNENLKKKWGNIDAIHVAIYGIRRFRNKNAKIKTTAYADEFFGSEETEREKKNGETVRNEWKRR